MTPGHGANERGFSPRILVFSTNNISDPGIDLAGSRHLRYAASVSTITVPCSSGIRPGWILHAIERGFDGVFIATDGDECAYLPDCNERSARIAAEAQDLFRAKGYEAQRVRMSALCSVCAEPFVKHMAEFSQMLKELGPTAQTAA
ncbi:MAG: hydrogenase iron-sulfur subunit [Acidimicrobiales bacterium]|jgi:coenzyme F420-reducing hydrogenase delta subunit